VAGYYLGRIPRQSFPLARSLFALRIREPLTLEGRTRLGVLPSFSRKFAEQSKVAYAGHEEKIHIRVAKVDTT